ncbi:putative signal peptide protein [Thiomonas sp. X19]|uniref:hypothetical protein n=1 Tax=Thiomonas sp. X19 TaxID=1050370 RepID=UPI000B6E5487|nr:hypothetical protein [Thiomonas sp. X19]SCC95045.1 putative signal peptide protein [Thiomonas sp. X19]
MFRLPTPRRNLALGLVWSGLALVPLAPPLAHAQETDPNRVYRCPDNSYTNMLSVVKAKNCKPVDNANVSVMSPTTPSKRPAAAPRSSSSADRVSPSTQTERDAEARRILDAELQSQQLKLQELLKSYNNGHPDYLGNEHNVGGGINQQKYLDRVAAMKNQITLTEANIQALQRELQRYGQ